MKNILKVSFGVLIVNFLVACSHLSQVKKCPILIGGWQAQSQQGADVEAALASVLARMNSKAKLKKVLEVRTQVVSGVNYDIEFQLDNGQIWNTRVYRDLEGFYHMTRTAQQGELPPLSCKR